VCVTENVGPLSISYVNGNACEEEEGEHLHDAAIGSCFENEVRDK
jgi:hypothetical protein